MINLNPIEIIILLAIVSNLSAMYRSKRPRSLPFGWWRESVAVELGEDE